MIEIGVYNELTILRTTSVGLYLGDDEGEDVLLPNKYCPDQYEVGDKLDVFVYLDYAERKVATNIDPKIKLHEFALLKTTSVENVGAFMDWGLEKELMVPFKEQRQRMEEGRWYIVFLDIDEKTDRLYATNKIEKRLQNDDLSIEQGDEVDLLVYTKTDLGYSMIINNQHKGLVFDNEVFRELNIGDKLKGFVKEIREDNKIDLVLSAVGYSNYNDSNANMILDKLNQNDGYIGVNDKSAPHEIYDEFGISKKAFKKAVGALYKNRDVSIESKGIRLNK